MKLTIITINFNDADALAATIDSVVKQTWQNFEYIIIDGGSTDKSVETIKQHQDRITYWVSEPDNGIYQAMNKGIAEATGEYLLMLNAGDLLCNESVLSQVFFTDAHKEDLLAGDVYRALDGKIFSESRFPDNLSFNFLRKGTLSHQATFIKRSLHETVGMYDENLRYASDWKLFILAVCKHNASYKHLPFFTATCDCNGLTCNPENFSAMKLENEQTLKHYFPAFLTDYAAYDSLLNKQFRARLTRAWVLAKNNLKNMFRYILS